MLHKGTAAECLLDVNMEFDDKKELQGEKKHRQMHTPFV